MMFPKYAAAALLGAALFAGPARAASADTAKAAGKDAKWLFIQTAPTIKFDGKTLTLQNINPSVVMFSDRPARMAEAIPTAAFVKNWDNAATKSFKSDPPDAGLTSIVDGKLQTATVELSHPQMDGTALRYDVRVVKGEVPASGGPASLFMDQIHFGPGPF